MGTWGDYLISEVSYDSEHLISVAIRHKDTDKGVTKGIPIDRLTIASDIKNGLLYITIYSGRNSWKQGCKINTFSINGSPYLRLDENKVKLDNLGDLPEVSSTESFLIQKSVEEEATPEQLARLEQLEKQLQELESKEEPAEEEEATPEQLARLEQLEKQLQELESKEEPAEEYMSYRGSLPKESPKKQLQELESKEEPAEEEEATPEQLARLEQLEKQLQELESKEEPAEEEEATPEQLARLEQLEKQLQELESKEEPAEEYMSYRGSLPKESPKKQLQELESKEEPAEEYMSYRGSLPKESPKKQLQELESKEEPAEEEEATPEQLSDLQKQISELEHLLYSEISSQSQSFIESEEATPEQLSDLQKQINELEYMLFMNLNSSSDVVTSEQSSQIKKLEKQLQNLESVDEEYEIINTLQKQSKKLTNIEKIIHKSSTSKNPLEYNLIKAYCVKCKTKREIKNLEETILKNGRDVIKGTCSVCNCKVFRIGKLKK